MSSLTKIFVVLQLVFSLVLAVIVVFGVSKLEDYRSQVVAAEARALSNASAKIEAELALKAAQASYDMAKQELQRGFEASARRLADLQAENATLNDKIRTLELGNSQLTAAQAAANAALQSAQAVNKSLSDELAHLRPENITLIGKNSELSRRVAELEKTNTFAEQAIRKLQEQIAASDTGSKTGTGPSAPNESQVALANAQPANAQVNGKITKIANDNGHTLIELPLGARDGIKVNAKLMIYRGGNYVGDAVVQRVTPDQSVANVTFGSDSVRQGDMVITAPQ